MGLSIWHPLFEPCFHAVDMLTELVGSGTRTLSDLDLLVKLNRIIIAVRSQLRAELLDFLGEVFVLRNECLAVTTYDYQC